MMKLTVKSSNINSSEVQSVNTSTNRRQFIGQVSFAAAGAVLVVAGCTPSSQTPASFPVITRKVGAESYQGNREAVLNDLEALKGLFAQVYNGKNGAFDAYLQNDNSKNYKALVSAYELFDQQLMAMDSAFRRDIPQAIINQDSRIRSGKSAAAVQIVMNHEEDFADPAAKLSPVQFKGGLLDSQKDLEWEQKAVAVNFQIQSLTRAWSPCGELIKGFEQILTVDSPHTSSGKRELVEQQFRAVAHLWPLVDVLRETLVR